MDIQDTIKKVIILSQIRWISVEPKCSPASRYRHTALVHNDRMYVFGGVD